MTRAFVFAFALALVTPTAVIAQIRSGMPGAEDDSGQLPAPQPGLAMPAPHPKPDAPATRKGPFNGTWTITYQSDNCFVRSGTFMVTVAGQSVVSNRGVGRITQSGHVRWTIPAQTDGAPITYSGTFSGSEGSGSFSRADGRCRGTFAAKRA